jgi:macrolide transport system ATP-binding/permease protein
VTAAERLPEIAPPAPDAAAAPAPVLIELDGVERTYGDGPSATRVLRGVSLTIRRGDFVAILGASGSGKSTLMNILGCLDRPTAGRYRLDGADVAALGPDALAALRRDVFGFVFQQYNLLPDASAEENVEIPAVYAGLPARARRERARALLARLGLADRTGYRPSQLSGGQQQRVSIARALMNGGRVVLADEPTGALDTASGREVMALLRRLNAEGRTVVLITHDPEVARQADRRIRIADGRIVDDDGGIPARAASPAPPDDAPARRSGPLAALGEAARMALRSMAANAFRTALTLLGIVVGVGAVIAMLAVGDGAKREVVERIEAMGTDLLLVRPGGPNMRGRANVATLVPEDAAALAGLPGVAEAVPEIQGSASLRRLGADHHTTVVAAGAGYARARDWPPAEGVFFDDEDVRAYAPVAVLGRTVADALFFDGADPVGQHVLVRNVPFQVIGVLSEKGATPWGADQDDTVLVPLTTGSLRLFGQRHLRSITVQVSDPAAIDAVQRAVEGMLLDRHGTEDFRVRNMASILETASRTQDTFTLLLGSIAAISLLVGGIGVMNIMLVGVTERTREIGIRMAAGAPPGAIRMQFLTEALVACAAGGLLGVAGGLGAAWAIGWLGHPVVLSLPPVLLAFGCAAGIGLLFGYLPARRASRLDPVAALAAD